MIEPIRLRFVVACSAEQAFATWTSEISLWWPRDHTVSGDAASEVHCEPGVGGRVCERTGAGDEIEWGHIVAWDPPTRVAYLWHLGTSREDGTDLDVVFGQQPDGTTLVELVHGGWDHVGAAGQERRDRNQFGWTEVVTIYTDACRGARQS